MTCHKYQSQVDICDPNRNKAGDLLSEFITNNDESALIKSLCTQVTNNSRVPCFVFAEKVTEELLNALKSSYDQTGVKYRYVSTPEDVKSLQASGAELFEGVYVFDGKFSRGINVKLGQPANVYILMNTRKHYSMSDLL